MLSTDTIPYIAPLVKIDWLCGNKPCADNKERIERLRTIIARKPQVSKLLGYLLDGNAKTEHFATVYAIVPRFCVYGIDDSLELPVEKCQHILEQIERVGKQVFLEELSIRSYPSIQYIQEQISVSECSLGNQYLYFALVAYDEVQKRIMGYVDVIHSAYANIAYIAYLFVHPEYRGLGIAYMLMNLIQTLLYGRVAINGRNDLTSVHTEPAFVDSLKRIQLCNLEQSLNKALQKERLLLLWLSNTDDISDPKVQKSSKVQNADFAFLTETHLVPYIDDMLIDTPNGGLMLIVQLHKLLAKHFVVYRYGQPNTICIRPILMLHVAQQNEKAIRLYSTLGFKPLISIPMFYAPVLSNTPIPFYDPLPKKHIGTDNKSTIEQSTEYTNALLLYKAFIDTDTQYAYSKCQKNKCYDSDTIVSESGFALESDAYTTDERSWQLLSELDAFAISPFMDTFGETRVSDVIRKLKWGAGGKASKGNEKSESEIEQIACDNQAKQETKAIAKETVQNICESEILYQPNGEDKILISANAISNIQKQKQKKPIKSLQEILEQKNKSKAKEIVKETYSENIVQLSNDKAYEQSAKTDSDSISTDRYALDIGFGNNAIANKNNSTKAVKHKHKAIAFRTLVTVADINRSNSAIRQEVEYNLEPNQLHVIPVALEGYKGQMKVKQVMDLLICEYKWTTYQPPAKKPYTHFLQSLSEKMDRYVLAGKVEIQMSPRLWYAGSDIPGVDKLYWLGMDFDAKHVGNNIEQAYRDCAQIARKARRLGLKCYIAPTINGFHLLVLELFALDKTRYTFENLRHRFRQVIEAKYPSLDVISSFRLTPFRGPGTMHPANLFMKPYTATEFIRIGSGKRIIQECKGLIPKEHLSEAEQKKLAQKIIDAWTFRYVYTDIDAVEVVVASLLGIAN